MEQTDFYKNGKLKAETDFEAIEMIQREKNIRVIVDSIKKAMIDKHFSFEDLVLATRRNCYLDDSKARIYCDIALQRLGMSREDFL